MASNGARRAAPAQPSPTQAGHVVKPEVGQRGGRRPGQLGVTFDRPDMADRGGTARRRGSPSRCRRRARDPRRRARAVRASAPPLRAGRSSARRRSARRCSRRPAARSSPSTNRSRGVRPRASKTRPSRTTELRLEASRSASFMRKCRAMAANAKLQRVLMVVLVVLAAAIVFVLVGNRGSARPPPGGPPGFSVRRADDAARPARPQLQSQGRRRPSRDPLGRPRTRGRADLHPLALP